jgi:hypothetical protein
MTWSGGALYMTGGALYIADGALYMTIIEPFLFGFRL